MSTNHSAYYVLFSKLLYCYMAIQWILSAAYLHNNNFNFKKIKANLMFTMVHCNFQVVDFFTQIK